MRFITAPALWLVCFLSVITLTESARILAITAVPSYSHQIPFQPLWVALSQRGHQVIVLTTDPIGDPSLTNLTEIDFRSNYNIFKKIDFAKLRFTDSWLTISRNIMWENFYELTDTILKHPKVQKMYAPNSDEHFDLVIAEVLMSPALYVLAHRFNAPLIGTTSLPLFASHYYSFGFPVLPSHPSTWEMEYNTGFNLSLWQRMTNFIRLWNYIYNMHNEFMSRQQALAKEYFGKDVPDIIEMEKNISIIFCNLQEITSFIRPQPQNVIYFKSFHQMKKPAALPNDLKTFLDDVPNGFIYVSLGTNVAIQSLPKHLRHVFYYVFANLPCKVVWKFDGDSSNLSNNIFAANWFPQQDILAHPKIRLFLYQGGAQSTEEAVYNAVPLLGIPILADQCTQVRKMVSIGVAKSLEIVDLTVKELNSSIMDILLDERYKERMLEIKALYEDKPNNMELEDAIWWTEFVIRHKGVSHLRTSIANESWYERYDMDIIAILSIIMFITLMITLLIIYKLLKIIFNWLCTKKPIDVKKKSN
ncbi:PREDICTED: UDP-glucuronosyltransferase 2B15-like [Dinoponera quadriceps]|uniref:UDP-glucuronosyltransferase 2B15-like n=1 Tax=Dinoponera quadriceps TaxID=609295 RepID=A0A6P3XV87_DINQU|nr:PREDICTED: UDP-glucuronosyltransferase 2B15-like [Dinoponera quadriceps]